MRQKGLDKNDVLKLLENNSEKFNIYIWDIDKELRSDEEIVLAFAKKEKDASVIQYAGNVLKNNKEFLLQVARCDENGYNEGIAVVLSYAGEEVKEDKEFFTELLQTDGSLYRFIGDTLKEDTDLRLISAISNIGNKFDNGASVLSFEGKINKFLSCIKNGISVQGEEKKRPYSFRVELENYELNKNYRAGIDEEIKEKSVYVQETSEEIKRQIDLLEYIKSITINKGKNVQPKTPLQSKEAELSFWEQERGKKEKEIRSIENTLGKNQVEQ